MQEQDAFAAWILGELASEQRWKGAFAHSEDALAQLADEALTDHREGRTQVLDPDRSIGSHTDYDRLLSRL